MPNKELYNAEKRELQESWLDYQQFQGKLSVLLALPLSYVFNTRTAH
jgi:hypothetical protein